VEGGNTVGGLVGYNDNHDAWSPGFIRFSHADVDVSGKAEVGGLAGSIHYGWGSIEDSYATGDVTGENYVGGLAGYIDAGGIFRSYATGNVVGNTSETVADAGRWVGGLVGTNYSSTISLCFATGNVTGGKTEIGGLVGQNIGAEDPWEEGVWIPALIENSYSTGAVVGASWVGGLVGSNATYGKIKYSYATGEVEATGEENPSFGGLAGVTGATGSEVISSYFDKETSGIDDGFVSYDKSTAQMKNKNTFTGWDFAATSNKWLIREGTDSKSYPYLYYQSAPAVITEAVETGVIINLSAPTSVDFYLEDEFQNTAEVTTASDKTYSPSGGTFEVGAKVTFITKEATKAPSYPANGIINRPEITDVTPHGAVATARLDNNLVLTFNRAVTGVAGKLITISVTTTPEGEPEPEPEPETTIYGYAIVAGDNSAEVEEEDFTYNKVTIPFSSFVKYVANTAEPPAPALIPATDPEVPLAIATGNTYKLSVDGGAFTSPSAFGDILTEANEASDPLFTFTTGKATLVASDFTVSDNVHTYTGTAKTATVTPKEGVGTLTTTSYYATSEPIAAVENPTNAGTYDIKVTVAASTDYLGTPNGGLKVGTLTINKVTLADTDLAISEDEVTYNGEAREVTVSINDEAGEESNIVDDDIDDVEDLGEITVYYTGVDPTDYAKSTTAPVNAGEYTITIEIEGANYTTPEGGLELGTFTINKVTLAATDFAISEDEVTYDGTAQEVTVSINDEAGEESNIVAGDEIEELGEISVYYTGVGETTYPKNETAPTNAGTYTITIEIEGANYATPAGGLALGTFTIEQVTLAETDFAISEDEVTYDGTAQEVEIIIDTEAEESNIVEGDAIEDLGTITVYYTGPGEDDVPTTEKPVNVGTYTITIDVAASDNYAAATGLELGTFTINKAIAEVEIPTIPTLTYAANATLLSVDLTDYETAYGSFSWVDDTESITPGETKDYDAVFTPSDLVNYYYTDVTGTWDDETGTFAVTITLTMDAAPSGGGEEPGEEEPGEEPGGEEEVPEVIYPDGVSLNLTSLTLKTGDTQQLIAIVTPLSADNRSVNWTSSNTKVATVSGGVITAVAAGTATITATTAVGGYRATCRVTVEERNVVVEAPKPESSKGVIEVSLNLPADGSFSCTFTLTLPQGLLLDQSLTALSEDLVADYQLDIAPKTGLTWQFDIRLKSSQNLRAAATYRNLVNIAYTIEETAADGNHEVKLTDVELKLSNNTVIREDEIVVSVTTGTPVGIAKASEGVAIRSEAGRLYVTSPAAETVYIYSFNGKLLYTATKASGLATFDAPSEKLLIVRGTSGWSRKVTN
jgi:hypothetical protein